MVILDTTIFIEYLRAKDKTKTILFNLTDSILYLSAVTYYELLMGATTESKKNDVITLTQELIILPFTDEISEKAAEIFHSLKKQNKLIEFRDIFIAATAISNQIPLKTLNRKHFERVQGLILL
jgi:tRNA(fMet)-specific endonuclease VapC